MPTTVLYHLHRICIISFFLLTESLVLYAQTITRSSIGLMSGTVISKDGEPLVGATVKFTDTQIGASRTQIFYHG
jgi:hypothetical protein